MTGQIINDLAQILWRQSWQLVLLVAIVWPIAQLSQKRYPRFTYILWLMVAVKSLLPIQISLPVANNSAILSNVQAIVSLSAIEAGTSQISGINYVQSLTWVWLAVVFALGLKLIIGEVRFRKSLEMTPMQNLSEVDSLMEYFKLKESPEILISQSITSPMTIGYSKPLVLLPENMQHQQPETLLPVIAHELAHIKRQDLWSISLQVALSRLYFFHPLMRIVNQQLDLNRERICDDMAVNALDLSYRQYGRGILTHMESIVKPLPTVAINGGMFMTKNNILKRFEYLMHGKGEVMLKIKTPQKVVIGVMGALLLLLSCTGGASEKKLKQINESETTLRSIGESTTKPLQVVMEDGSLENIPIPPPNDNVVFVEYDSPPEPLGGYSAIQKAVIYPEKAMKAGIQGTIIVQATIGADGVARDAVVLKGVPDTGLDEAAMKALLSLKWKPASQKDKPVAVKISVPVVFKLKTK